MLAENDPRRLEEMGKGMEAWVLAYEMGPLAVAHAINLSSHDAVMVGYQDDIVTYGWEESFRRNVGMSVEEFYESFAVFRTKTFDEQWEAISDQFPQ